MSGNAIRIRVRAEHPPGPVKRQPGENAAWPRRGCHMTGGHLKGCALREWAVQQKELLFRTAGGKKARS